ncbi:DinB superfamily protein [Ekhidna lutea]|uniref:DinB superfamily protein n=1 Tax=Ekhidna lutea TaxID=447679 RepID=A0A239LNG8_EKHLU|nr:DinB family protein [Ekhidna lutea]SNT31154.1 DinB superfamily protein [Ekhidna lutea]
MCKGYFFFSFLFTITSTFAQQADSTDYYYQIPEYPDEYNAGTTSARIVDGLGFRYYWGTAGLTESDLNYRPSEGARNVEETIDHILSLTQILVDAVNEKPFEGVEIEGLSYQEKRSKTLENIREASDVLKKSSGEDLDRFDMVFPSAEFPFWNLLNGPIADAINHVGQIITLRRTNGNPIDQNISVLQGRVRD